MLAGRERHGSPSPLQSPAYPFSRLKPIQKMEGMTNGVAVGPQQATGLSDISAQVQQYQQFLGEGSLDSGVGPGQGLWPQRACRWFTCPPGTSSPPVHTGELLLGSKVVPT